MMRVLPSSSVVFFTVVTIVCIAATLSSELRCPKTKPPSCWCSITPYGYEIQCLAFTVQVIPQAVVRIQCTSNDVSDFSMLNGMRIGDINTLIIRLCPLPSVSLSQLMQNIGMFNVSKVQIMYMALHSNYTTTVTRELFHGLSNITRLMLHTNSITQMTDDVFTDMPNLTLIDLKNNNIVLPKAIFSSVPKLQILELGSNNLTYLEPGVFHNLTQLRLLNLWGNSLHKLSRAVFSDVHNLECLDINSNKMTDLTPDLFVDLIKLRKINLFANEFISLPKNLFINNPDLETVNIQDNKRTLKTLPPRLLADLTKLKEVKLHSCNMSTLPEDLLWDSTSVNTISLNKNAFTTLPELLFKDCIELQTLDISFNQITDLPNRLFSDTRNLKILKLNNNQLSVITHHFSFLNKLEVLDLKNNRLVHIQTEAFIGLTSLKVVNISNNMLIFKESSVNRMMDLFGKRSPLHLCSMLEDIQLANNSLTEIFVDWRLSMNNLENVNLAYNKISQIQTTDLQFNSRKNTFVDISYNNISEIDMIDAETVFRPDKIMNPYERDSIEVRHFFIEGNPINCDCKLYSLLRYFGGEINPKVKLRLEITPGTLQCVKPEAYAGQLVENIPVKLFTCLLNKEYSPNCPEQCSCLLRPSDKVLIVDCHQRNLTSMPEVLPDIKLSNYTELILSGNSIKLVKSPLGPGYHKVTKYILSDNMISEINVTAFSQKLQILELDGNSITQFNKPSIEFLMNAKYLKEMTLHQNPWRCDCTTKDFKTMIQTHFAKVKLLHNIICENGKAILDMTDTDLCPVKTIIVADVSYPVVVFGLLFAVFIIYYRHQSVLHFTLELETRPPTYTLGLRYRQCIAGKHKPTHIARSKEES